MSCPYKRNGYSQCLSPYNSSTNGGINATSNGYDSQKCYGLNSEHETCEFYRNDSITDSVNVISNIRLKCPHCDKDIFVEL